MPKLDISVDEEFYQSWNKYLEDHPYINKSALVRKLIHDFLVKEGVVNERAKKRGTKKV